MLTNWKACVSVAIQSAIITWTVVYLLFWIISFGPTPLDILLLWLLSMPIALVLGVVAGLLSCGGQNKKSPVFIRILTVSGIVIGIVVAIIVSNSLINNLVAPDNRLAYNIVAGISVLIGGVIVQLLLVISAMVLHRLAGYFAN